jgi:hypothetical protein
MIEQKIAFRVLAVAVCDSSWTWKRNTSDFDCEEGVRIERLLLERIQEMHRFSGSLFFVQVDGYKHSIFSG